MNGKMGQREGLKYRKGKRRCADEQWRSDRFCKGQTNVAPPPGISSPTSTIYQLISTFGIHRSSTIYSKVYQKPPLPKSFRGRGGGSRAGKEDVSREGKEGWETGRDRRMEVWKGKKDGSRVG